MTNSTRTAPRHTFKKGLYISQEGGTGKTTLTNNLEVIFSQNTKFFQMESVDDFQKLEGAEVFPSHDVAGVFNAVRRHKGNVILDAGSSCKRYLFEQMEARKNLLTRAGFTSIVMPIVPDSRSIRTYLDQIVTIVENGFPANKIRVVFNKMSPVDIKHTPTYLQKFIDDLAMIGVITKSENSIGNSEMFPLMKKYGLNIKDVLNDDNDYQKVLNDVEDGIVSIPDEIETEDDYVGYLWDMIDIQDLCPAVVKQLENIHGYINSES